MKRFFQKKAKIVIMVCFAVAFLLPLKFSYALELVASQDYLFSDYVTIGGVVFLALMVFGFIIYNNIKSIKRLNNENKSMQRRITNYEVANKVFGSVFFEGSHETKELTFDENYSEILGRIPYYKKLSEFGQPHPYVYPEDLKNIARFAQNLQKGAKYASAEYRFIMPNGSLVWHKIEAQTFFELNGKPASLVGRIININNQKLEMLRLQQLASSDSLTGLLSNRPAKATIAEFLQGEGKQGTHALYLLDLDNFHDVNYIVGHFTGDSILSLIAEKLKAQFSENDIFARIGGDEFIVLQKNVGTKSEIKAKAETVLQVLSFTHESQIQISCSVGVAIVSNGDKDLDSLFKEADIAMFSAKSIGKNRLVIFPHKDDSTTLSEQEQAIIDIAESSAKAPFGNVINYTNSGIVILEMDSKISMIYASESFYRLKKSKSRKMRFLWDEFIFSIHRADRENVVNALQSAKETPNMIEISFRIYNRSLKFVWYNIRAVRNEKKHNEIIVLVSDVTELLQSNVQLDYLLQ